MAIPRFPDNPLPELMLVCEEDATTARRVQRLARRCRRDRHEGADWVMDDVRSGRAI
jgi:hypothetical protein